MNVVKRSSGTQPTNQAYGLNFKQLRTRPGNSTCVRKIIAETDLFSRELAVDENWYVNNMVDHSFRNCGVQGFVCLSRVYSVLM